MLNSPNSILAKTIWKKKQICQIYNARQSCPLYGIICMDFLVLKCVCLHTCARTYEVYTYVHGLTHHHTHSPSHTLTFTHTHPHTHSPSHTLTLPHSPLHTSTLTHTHPCCMSSFVKLASSSPMSWRYMQSGLGHCTPRRK